MYPVPLTNHPIALSPVGGRAFFATPSCPTPALNISIYLGLGRFDILNQNTPKRGRPPTGNAAVHVRLSAEVLDALDAYQQGRTSLGNRQDAVRTLLQEHLALIGYLPAAKD